MQGSLCPADLIFSAESTDLYVLSMHQPFYLYLHQAAALPCTDCLILLKMIHFF